VATVGKLVVEITGDSSQLNKNLDTSQKKLKGISTTAKASLAVVATAVAAAAFQIGKASIAAASRAEETESKFRTVFSSIQDSAEEAAENLQENFGLSSRAAQQLLSDTGDLLSGFGFTQEAALDLATQVNTLAVDLASFTNFSGGAEGASAALTKALLGERESLKSLGIAITEADIKRLAEDKGITGTLDRQTKAALTLELAIQQSKNAIGDFARTQESFANQTRIAEANTEELFIAIGRKLQPAAAAALSVFNNTVVTITEIIEGQTQLERSTKIITSAVESYTIAQNELNTASADLTETNKLLLETQKSIATQDVLLQVNKLNELIKEEDKRQENLNNKIENANRLIGERSKRLAEVQGRIQLVNEGNRDSATTLKDLSDAQEVISDQISDLANVKIPGYTTAIAESKEAVTTSFEGIAAAINAGIISTENLTFVNETAVKRIIELTKRLKEQKKELDNTAGSQGKNTQITKDIAAITSKLNADLKILTKEYKLFGDEIDVNKEKAALYKTSLEKLIKLGLSPQAPLLINLKKRYDEYNASSTDAAEKTSKRFEELDEKATESLEKLFEERDAALVDAAEREDELILQTEETLKNSIARRMALYWELANIATGAANSIADIFNNISQQNINNIDAEIEAERNKEVINEELIKELEAEKLKIQTDAAIKTRLIASFGAAVNTAEAITKALASAPPPFNFALAAANAAAGALQIAAINSEPLPFLAGGLVQSPTNAIVGEGGRKEAILPLENPNAMRLIADSIVSALPIPTTNIVNNTTQATGPMILQIGDQEFNAFLTNSSRNGKFLIDANRGVV
jgi:hypothetical protein